MKNIENLNKILDCSIETIQDSTFLDEVNDTQKITLTKSLIHISNNMCRPLGKHLTLTYRGENFGNLSSKLMSEQYTISEDKLVSLLFYFGDKAKHFYEIDDEEAKKSRWIKRIEDNEAETLGVIFNKIKDLLKNRNKKIVHFCEKNHEFKAYFTTGNKDHFITNLIEDMKYGRDYYLFLLHTAGKIGIGNKSLLVSTSRSYDVAERFSGDAGKRYVLYYVTPYPLKDYAVSHSLRKSYEYHLEKLGLPTYKGMSLYPDQNEVAIKGALFSHHILGLLVVDENRFIANPHLFKSPNSYDSFSSGLQFDQSNFSGELSDTSYKRGVGTFLDGHYHSIMRT